MILNNPNVIDSPDKNVVIIIVKIQFTLLTSIVKKGRGRIETYLETSFISFNLNLRKLL